MGSEPVLPEALPEFPYHPDPLATGFVGTSDAKCVVCERSRGYVYTGPVHATEELIDAFCPWCIANGKAAEKFAAEFTDVGWGVPEGVPVSVTEAIAQRTPGFFGWQQDHWLYHCNDGAAFLGLAGRAELADYPEALKMLRQECAEYSWTHEQIESYLDELDSEGEATAYLFRCRHCGTHLAYSDSS